MDLDKQNKLPELSFCLHRQKLSKRQINNDIEIVGIINMVQCVFEKQWFSKIIRLLHEERKLNMMQSIKLKQKKVYDEMHFLCFHQIGQLVSTSARFSWTSCAKSLLFSTDLSKQILKKGSPLIANLPLLTSRFIWPCKSWNDARFGITQFVTPNKHVLRNPGV